MLRDGANQLSAGGPGVFSSVTDQGLTSGRVVIVGTGGLLEDDADFTYDKTTNTLTTTTVVAALTGTASGNLVSGGALGTPSSGVVTNLTGTAAGVSIGGNAATATTAGTVTTAAQPAITSVGTLTALSISGTITSTAGIVLSATAATTAFKYATIYNTGGGVQVGVDSAAGGSNIVGDTAYDATIRGKTGISVSADEGTTLHQRIASTGAQRWPTYGAGAATFDASGNITSVSDERVKTNIRPFKAGLKEILLLAPILHGYTKESGLDQTKDDYASFIAQAVQKVIPEAVGKMADRIEPEFLGPPEKRIKNPRAGEMIAEGMLTLNDRAILAALVNAVKELAQAP